MSIHADERDILLPEGFIWVRSPAHSPTGVITCTTCHASTNVARKGDVQCLAFTNFHEELHAA